MEKEKRLIEKYKKLQSKYDLPEFSILNQEFEIWTISPKSPFILREIRRAIQDKIESTTRLLERSLYPSEGYLSDVYESSIFSKKDIERIFKVYKEMQKLLKKMYILEVDSSEKMEAEIIKTAYKKWIDLKKEVLWLLNKKLEYWEKEPSYKEPKEYMG